MYQDTQNLCEEDGQILQVRQNRGNSGRGKSAEGRAGSGGTARTMQADKQ